jgi:hypothetical protein
MNKSKTLAVAAAFCLVSLLALTYVFGWRDRWERPGYNAEIRLIQIDKVEMDAIEKEVGFHLNPPDGKVLLTPDERKKLLAAFEQAESAEYLEVEQLRAFPECCNLRKQAEEIRYPTSFEVEHSQDGRIPLPTDFQTRDTGLWCDLHFVENTPGLLSVLLSVYISRLMGWQEFNDGSVQPVFKSWHQSSTLVIPNGMTYVSKQIAPSEFNTSIVLSDDPGAEKQKTKYCILLLGIKRGTSAVDSRGLSERGREQELSDKPVESGESRE